MTDTRHASLEDPRFIGGIEMLRRTGMCDFEIRYQDDNDPTVWIAVAHYDNGKHKAVECAASVNPVEAVMRLCAQVVDGGLCVHCKRPTGFEEDHFCLPLADLVCWYQWDPELKTFRRGCE